MLGLLISNNKKKEQNQITILSYPFHWEFQKTQTRKQVINKNKNPKSKNGYSNQNKLKQTRITN